VNREIDPSVLVQAVKNNSAYFSTLQDDVRNKFARSRHVSTTEEKKIETSTWRKQIALNNAS
jgi:hypothetical protein